MSGFIDLALLVRTVRALRTAISRGEPASGMKRLLALDLIGKFGRMVAGRPISADEGAFGYMVALDTGTLA